MEHCTRSPCVTAVVFTRSATGVAERKRAWSNRKRARNSANAATCWTYQGDARPTTALPPPQAALPIPKATATTRARAGCLRILHDNAPMFSSPSNPASETPPVQLTSSRGYRGAESELINPPVPSRPAPPAPPPTPLAGILAYIVVLKKDEKNPPQISTNGRWHRHRSPTHSTPSTAQKKKKQNPGASHPVQGQAEV